MCNEPYTQYSIDNQFVPLIHNNTLRGVYKTIKRTQIYCLSVHRLSFCNYYHNNNNHESRYTVGPSILDTVGPEGTVLMIEVSSFKGLKMYYSKAYSQEFGSSGMCPHKMDVCNSGSWIRGVSAIQGAGLEGFCCSGSYVCRDDAEET